MKFIKKFESYYNNPLEELNDKLDNLYSQLGFRTELTIENLISKVPNEKGFRGRHKTEQNYSFKKFQLRLNLTNENEKYKIASLLCLADLTDNPFNYTSMVFPLTSIRSDGFNNYQDSMDILIFDNENEYEYVKYIKSHPDNIVKIILDNTNSIIAKNPKEIFTKINNLVLDKLNDFIKDKVHVRFSKDKQLSINYIDPIRKFIKDNNNYNKNEIILSDRIIKILRDRINQYNSNELWNNIKINNPFLYKSLEYDSSQQSVTAAEMGFDD